MDSIRRALGEDQISYFGFSYGSELGAAWATLFPDTVRAAVLDGASDPEADALESSLQQLAGLRGVTRNVPRSVQCRRPAVRSTATAMPDRRSTHCSSNSTSAPCRVTAGRPSVNRDVAITAIVQAMYSEPFWPALERSLAAARLGDGSGLLALHDSYYQRAPDGSYGNELEAFQAISCADTPERPSVEETDAEAAQFTKIAPRLARRARRAAISAPSSRSRSIRGSAITGAGAGPIVVIGTTGDPATPFQSTVNMSNALEDGRLLIVEADQHTGYGVNRCVIDLVNNYLIDLRAAHRRNRVPLSVPSGPASRHR